MKNEEKILKSIKDKHLILNETVDKIREEMDELFSFEIDNNANSPKNDGRNSISMDKVNNDLASLLCLNDGDDGGQTNEMENSTSHSLDELIDDSFAEINMQSLGTLTLQLGDLDDQHLAGMSSGVNIDETNRIPVESNKSSGNPVGKKVISSFKNIKDKMKNISLNKDNKLRSPSIDLSKTNTIDTLVAPPDNETVKAETDRIFDKYRSSKQQAILEN
ncbi:hypothetical protein BLA29_010402, partial [Euroglyphus maynei]